MNYSQLDADALLRTEQVATWLDVSKSFLDKARVYGRGPTYLKLEGSVRYRVSEVRRWLSEVERSSTRVAFALDFMNDAPSRASILGALSFRTHRGTMRGPQPLSKTVQSGVTGYDADRRLLGRAEG